MANCSNCSAPLAANTNKCEYCGTRNDVDLKGKHAFSMVSKETALPCPHCEKPLQTVDLDLDESFQIERCATCFGLFLGPGKTEILLEKSVHPVFEINLLHLDSINKDRFQTDNEIKYVKCPVCRTLMDRKAFGYRSGVIIDRCQNHGIWLDSGEITHLMEWKKAGGQLLHEQQKMSENRNPVKQRSSSAGSNSPSEYADVGIESELLDTLVTVIERLFE